MSTIQLIGAALLFGPPLFVLIVAIIAICMNVIEDIKNGNFKGKNQESFMAFAVLLSMFLGIAMLIFG